MTKPSLAEAFRAPREKRAYVRRLFGTIADRYDLITRLLSFGLDRGWKRRLVALAEVSVGATVLDLACGTGDIGFEAERHGGRVVGLDVTPRMIALARKKPEGGRVRWVVGDMTDLPVADGVVDVVTTGYGLRNVPDLERSLHEIHRVLRSGGVACSLDFDRPDNALVRSVYLTYLTVIGAGLGWLLHRDADTYRYIPASIRRYPGARRVAEMMRYAGFHDVEVFPVLGGLMAIHRFRK
jgi:demethylmenaquinone methyltransferase/2-methoxy-6-polyprenyl-1,4-benzoquinol methylase